MTRVLLYNWADLHDPEGRGGGVGVYLRNLAAAMLAQGGVEIGFLSAGLSYGLRRTEPGWRALPPLRGDGGVRRYAVVNSGLLAPAHADFASPAQLSHPATEAVFADFLARTGPWDVIHFHNLEGLPVAVLDLARRLGGGRVVLSLHNYYPFCPQVNFWRHESLACTDFRDGAACVDCLPVRPDPRSVRLAHGLGGRLHRIGAGPGTPGWDYLFRPVLGAAWRGYKRLRRRAAPTVPAVETKGSFAEAAAHFAARRRVMVAQINAGCDAVLCVSDRVRAIAAAHGIEPARLRTAYIGSPEARHWNRHPPAPGFLAPDGTLHLGFLGYMRRDKGFPFLLEALDRLAPETLARLRLTVAARRGEGDIHARLLRLRPRLAGLSLHEGYHHDQLDRLLDGVALGLVPVMWEDNLPQVAIEMHARRIPLMCSDLGGAQELGRCPQLVFRAGDHADFARVLGRVLDGSLLPADYWANARAPVSMAEHVADLMPVYRG